MQAAGFMAATIGRLTGELSCALSTLGTPLHVVHSHIFVNYLCFVGPGATNFSTAIAYAELGGFPCLFLTGQKPIRVSYVRDTILPFLIYFIISGRHQNKDDFKLLTLSSISSKTSPFSGFFLPL